MSESNAIATINSTEGFQRLAQFSTSAAAKELAVSKCLPAEV